MKTTCNDCASLNEGRTYSVYCKHCNAIGNLVTNIDPYVCHNCGLATTGVIVQPIKCRGCVESGLAGNIDKKPSVDDETKLVTKCKGISYYCFDCFKHSITHIGSGKKVFFNCHKCDKLMTYTNSPGCDCCRDSTGNTVIDKEPTSPERADCKGIEYKCYRCNHVGTTHYEGSRFNCAQCDWILTSNYTACACQAVPPKVEPKPNATSNPPVEDKNELVTECKGITYVCPGCLCHNVFHTNTFEVPDFKCSDCDIPLPSNDVYCKCILSTKVEPMPVFHDKEPTNSEKVDCKGLKYECRKCDNIDIIHKSNKLGSHNCTGCGKTVLWYRSSCKCAPLHVRLEPKPVVSNIPSKEIACEGRRHECSKCGILNIIHKSDRFTTSKCVKCNDKIHWGSFSCKCASEQPRVESAIKQDNVTSKDCIKVTHSDTEDTISIGDKVICKVKTDDTGTTITLLKHNVEVHFKNA